MFPYFYDFLVQPNIPNKFNLLVLFLQNTTSISQQTFQ